MARALLLSALVTTYATTTGETLHDDLVCSGRYRIRHKIMGGTTGHLFRADRIEDGCPVVLKCGSTGNPVIRAFLGAGASALEALGHPGIVRLVEHCEGRDVTFLALEALDGTDLATRRRAAPVSRGEALRWLRDVGSALDHVHSRALVHRDIKPANVMIVPTEGEQTRAVLVDFGLARARRTGKERARFLCGTPAYMAPEQALGLEAETGPASDRYALAAVALELITGQRPYPPASVPELITMLIGQPPRLPSELGPFGPPVDAVFVRALARDPEGRFETCAAFVDALERALPRTVARRGVTPMASAERIPTRRASASRARAA